MRLGFFANYSPETAAFASETGFDSLELSAWPRSALDADKVTDTELGRIRRDLDAKDIKISALGYYPNFFDPDAETRQNARRYFVKVLDLAVRMDVDTVATFAGRDPAKNVEENIPLFREVFSRFCEEAEKRSVKIAIENCPMIDRKTLRGINIAYSPEIWDAMFDAVPSKSLGLEFDPSHMVWQGIDYIEAVHDYASRIFHVHAKDMEINQRVLKRVGIYGQAFGVADGLGHGWWRARAPGWGEVDWPRFITAVIESGYRGNIDIEHEDDIFAQSSLGFGKVDHESEVVANYSLDHVGLRLGYATLAPLIPRTTRIGIARSVVA